MANNVLKLAGKILNPIIPRYEKLKGVVLYENNTLTDGKHGVLPPITLSDDVSNYKMIEIFYDSANYIKGSYKINISKANELRFSLIRSWFDGTNTWFINTPMLINGKKITYYQTNKGMEFYIGSSGVGSSSYNREGFYINKVLGYK